MYFSAYNALIYVARDSIYLTCQKYMFWNALELFTPEHDKIKQNLQKLIPFAPYLCALGHSC